MKIYFIAFLFLTLGFISSKAQSSSELEIEALDNHAILKHYSKEDLNLLKTTDSLKYNTIIYYYTKSFILTPVSCTDCIVYDIKKFDVSTVEKYRLQNTRFEHIFDKYGFKLTLLSINELEYKLPIHLP